MPIVNDSAQRQHRRQVTTLLIGGPPAVVFAAYLLPRGPVVSYLSLEEAIALLLLFVTGCAVYVVAVSAALRAKKKPSLTRGSANVLVAWGVAAITARTLEAFARFGPDLAYLGGGAALIGAAVLVLTSTLHRSRAAA